MHNCPKCGIETDGSWSEGGIKWAVCEDCMVTENSPHRVVARNLKPRRSPPPPGNGASAQSTVIRKPLEASNLEWTLNYDKTRSRCLDCTKRASPLYQTSSLPYATRNLQQAKGFAQEKTHLPWTFSVLVMQRLPWPNSTRWEDSRNKAETPDFRRA